MNLDDFRQTGRTQRMLQAAVERAREGVWVGVIAANEQHGLNLYTRLLEFGGASGTNPTNGKVYFSDENVGVEGSVSVMNAYDPQFNWRRRALIGAHPSCEIFVDHFALENRMGWMLHEWLEAQ